MQALSTAAAWLINLIPNVSAFRTPITRAVTNSKASKFCSICIYILVGAAAVAFGLIAWRNPVPLTYISYDGRSPDHSNCRPLSLYSTGANTNGDGSTFFYDAFPTLGDQPVGGLNLASPVRSSSLPLFNNDSNSLTMGFGAYHVSFSYDKCLEYFTSPSMLNDACNITKKGVDGGVTWLQVSCVWYFATPITGGTTVLLLRRELFQLQDNFDKYYEDVNGYMYIDYPAYINGVWDGSYSSLDIPSIYQYLGKAVSSLVDGFPCNYARNDNPFYCTGFKDRSFTDLMSEVYANTHLVYMVLGTGLAFLLGRYLPPPPSQQGKETAKVKPVENPQPGG